MSLSQEAVVVVITGAAGQIGYSLIPLVAKGLMLGPSQPVILRLLEITPVLPALNGLVMELEDCAYPLLRGIVCTDKPDVAFKEADYVLFVGAFPRKEGMERKDLISKNAEIFSTQGRSLDVVAKKTVKVVVVGNPANTNCLILMKSAPSIPRQNFTCLTRLDHNRAIGQLAIQSKQSPSDIKNPIIWGNHSSTQYPDVRFAKIGDNHLVTTVLDKQWLQNEFVTIIQQRGAAVLKTRGNSSVMSAANAIIDHMHDWILGTPEGVWVSMGVVTDGSYGIKDELIFSCPVTCTNGSYKIVTGLDIDPFSQAKIEATQNELLEERKTAFEIVGIKS